MRAPAQAISQALARFGADARFATRFAVQADPQLHVEGVGEVTLPVSIQGAHRLCAVARPAHHGYKDQTRLDPRVRDTWEIPASAIRFDSPQWAPVLAGALKKIAAELGLPSGVRLDAELHNLLVYGPGQFFAVHQDSEKAEGMLGTLVVTLPSTFTGGEFVVSHQGQILRARGSASQLGMLAFYADCLHEVRAVKRGYRVALTYNLMVQGGARPAELPPQELDALARAVRTFWQTPVPPRWHGDTATGASDRLVYLLDHQYTPAGLAWTHLKGADAVRARALRAVAQRLEADIFLTLADVHETWEAQDEYEYGRSRHDEWDEDDEYDDEEEDPPDTGGLVLGDLIDSEIELRHWLAADGSRFESDSNGTGKDELCFTRASSDCNPFQSEYEGYMGNYGNTLDRWYHRAAVVMWPRERAFAIRARQAPRWAIDQIVSLLAAGDVEQARASARQLLPFWKTAVGSTGASVPLDVLLLLATALDDAGLAAELLEPFTLAQLTAPAAPGLLALLEHYGADWCEQRWQQWSQLRGDGTSHLAWLADTLPVLTHTLAAAKPSGAAAFVSGIVKGRWHWLQQHIAQQHAYKSGGAQLNALVETAPALLGLIRADQEGCPPAVQPAAIDMLLSPSLPWQVPLAVLHAAAAKPASTRVSVPALESVRAWCAQALAERLARPERADGDWSIPLPAELEQPAAAPPRHGYVASMLGELGPPLARFLQSPTEQGLEWPLAEARRQCIQQFIDRHGLPVRHETRRSGRPYTLVLEKTQALFEREAAERHQWVKELAWLQGSQSRFR